MGWKEGHLRKRVATSEKCLVPHPRGGQDAPRGSPGHSGFQGTGPQFRAHFTARMRGHCSSNEDFQERRTSGFPCDEEFCLPHQGNNVKVHLRHFSTVVTKHRDQDNLGKEGFIGLMLSKEQESVTITAGTWQLGVRQQVSRHGAGIAAKALCPNPQDKAERVNLGPKSTPDPTHPDPTASSSGQPYCP